MEFNQPRVTIKKRKDKSKLLNLNTNIIKYKKIKTARDLTPFWELKFQLKLRFGKRRGNHGL
jgi:hypothetical protein